MNAASDLKFFWEAFVTLLVITDPPGVVPPFLALTRVCRHGCVTGWPGRRPWWRSG